jgi:hypothetical protein
MLDSDIELWSRERVSQMTIQHGVLIRHIETLIVASLLHKQGLATSKLFVGG